MPQVASVAAPIARMRTVRGVVPAITNPAISALGSRDAMPRVERLIGLLGVPAPAAPASYTSISTESALLTAALHDEAGN